VTVIVVLLAASAVEGFLLGYFCSHWAAFAFSGIVLALAAAWFLRAQGTATAAGIAIIVACLTVNQFAFLFAAFLRTNQEPKDGE
jgi:hypothetical protein